MTHTPTSRARIWTFRQFEPVALEPLEPLADMVVGKFSDTDEWDQLASTCDAIIATGEMPMTNERIERIGPRLRVIGRPGIGVDKIDLAAATKHGILVVNTPDAPSESTAEHALALLLDLAKRVTFADRVLRSGSGFPAHSTFPRGIELLGASLGLVGLGRIGGRVAEVARVLGMQVRAYDPFASPERAASLGVQLVPTLTDVLEDADFVSTHCPSIPETYHIINATTLAQMKPGAFFINVSRGALVDEQALADALRSGHLAGAGLDVFDPEPTVADHPFYSLPNTICTPHIGSYTGAGAHKMEVGVCEQIAMALRGERPTNLVNPTVWGQHRA